MTKEEANKYLNAPTIGVYSTSAFGGYEVKEFEFEIEEYIIFVEQPMNRVHRCRIHHEPNGSYFKFNNDKIYLRNIMRIQ